jgi:hypothetical protein
MHGQHFNVSRSVSSGFFGHIGEALWKEQSQVEPRRKKGSQVNLTASSGGNKKGKGPPYISRALLP